MKKIVILLLIFTISLGGVWANQSLQNMKEYELTTTMDNIWKDQEDNRMKESAGLPTTKPHLNQLIALKQSIPSVDPQMMNVALLTSMINDTLNSMQGVRYKSGDSWTSTRTERNTVYDMSIIFVVVMRTYTAPEDRLLAYNTILGNKTIANQFAQNEDKFIDAFMHFVRNSK